MTFDPDFANGLPVLRPAQNPNVPWKKVAEYVLKPRSNGRLSPLKQHVGLLKSNGKGLPVDRSRPSYEVIFKFGSQVAIEAILERFVLRGELYRPLLVFFYQEQGGADEEDKYQQQSRHQIAN